MPLQVLPVVISDFAILENLTEEQGGTLVDPLILDVWSVSSTQDSWRRRVWSATQNKGRFLHDKTAHFVKVVDTDLGDEIVSLARWHFYEHGFPSENMWMEVDIFTPPPSRPEFPDGLRGDDLTQFIAEAVNQRKKWKLTAQKCWILTSLVTRSSHRRRGAGGLLVDWGAEQARKMGVVACLEADPSAKSMYVKHGFWSTLLVTQTSSPAKRHSTL